MSLTAKKSIEGTRETCPTGVFQAACYGVYDIGTQYSKKWDAYKPQVIISWELVHEKMSDNRPFVLSKTYTNSLHEKANLRKDLESWFGRALTAEEMENGFDLKKCINENCQLQVIHNKVDDKTYANISSIMALPKGASPLNPENETVVFEIESKEIPSSVYDWIADRIKTSMEWKGEDVYDKKGNNLTNPDRQAPPEEHTDLEPF